MTGQNISTEAAFAAREYEKERLFWLETLSGELVRSCFPPDNAREKDTPQKKETLAFGIEGALFERLIKAGNKSDSRLHMLMIAGFTLLLARYSGTRDIILGTPIDKQEVEGDFINTALALRIRLRDDMSFKDLLMQIREVVIEAADHQNFPIETLPVDLDLSSGDGSFPLFDAAILLENIQDKSYIDHLDINMVFSFNKTGNSIEGTVEYNAHCYRAETIERIARHFKNIMQNGLNDAGAPVAGLEMLTPEERKQLLHDFNLTEAGFPRDKTLHRLFEEQVEKTPGNTAVMEARSGDGEAPALSYRRLNQKANQMARVLLKKGAGRGTAVCIMGQRKIEIMTAILAVLKTGAAYLPLDARNPMERNRFIMEDGKAVVLLTQRHLLDTYGGRLEHFSDGSVLLADDPAHFPGDGDPGNPGVACDASDPAYIIYTSGTTGRPKGVVIRHRSAVNYLCWAVDTYLKGEPLNFPVYTSISFDLTVTSLFVPLITGASAVLYGGGNSDILIERIIDDNQVGVIKLTPSHMYLIRDKKVRHSGLKRFVAGGEILDTHISRTIHDNFYGNVEIYNEYGPTEATVGCMVYRFDPKKDRGKNVPIGVPIANTRIYILDDRLNPVPIGAVGELYISGDGLAAGYLERPQLTGEKFVDNPFVEGTRIYATGDLARWKSGPDGSYIDFLGRRDHQVKIRGYRVELGEIEKQVLEYEGVKNAVVLALESREHLRQGQGFDGSEAFLCAYLVRDQGKGPEDITIPRLREYLSGRLPDYMIPAFFEFLEIIPLTEAGKVDRKALPEPQIRADGAFIAPRDDIERKMVEIWADVLGAGAEEISIDANYFEIGGHSLNATLLVARIYRELFVKLKLVDIFEKATVRALSQHVKEIEKEAFVAIDPVEPREYYFLSSAQKRLFFLQEFESRDNISYNIPVVFNVTGALDRKKLEDIFNVLIQRHESLRTAIEMVEDEPRQKIYDTVDFKVEYFEAGEEEARRIIDGFIRPFDLARPPLLRVGLVKTAEERFIQMLDMHHIVSDGVSMDIISAEFMVLYEGAQLQDLRIQYKDYAHWQSSDTYVEALERQKHYWLKEMDGELPIMDLPLDFARPAVQVFDGNFIYFEMEQQLVKGLNNLVKEENVTMYMLLLALVNLFFYKITHREDIILGTDNAGRRHTDLEYIVGMFVNTLAMRNYPASAKMFSQSLQEIKKRTLSAFENQDFQFEDLVEAVVQNRDVSRNPLFDVMFAHQKIEREGLEIPGLQLGMYEFDYRKAKFDMTWTAIEREGTIFLALEYCTKLFTEQTIRAFYRYFENIVRDVIANPDRALKDIQILTEEEKNRLIVEFNASRAEFPTDTSVYHFVERHAQKTPQKTALMFQGQEVTYDDLNRRVNRLAGLLTSAGAGKDKTVGILLERSILMAEAILAVWKAGGAYIPIDSQSPPQRILGILKDSGSGVLLTHSQSVDANLRDEYAGGGVVFCLDESREDIARRGDANPEARLDTSALAYVIYTSGSTGKPKGAMVEHIGMMNHIQAKVDDLQLTPGCIIAQNASHTFDISVWQFFAAMVPGGTTAVYSNPEVLEPDSFMDKVIRDRVTILEVVPSYLSVMLETLSDEFKSFDDIAYLLVTGETVKPNLLERWFELYPRIKVVNAYGPTEASDDITHHIMDKAPQEDRVPIGKTLQNLNIYIVDDRMNLCPAGIKGEICVSGVGVGRGYLEDPEKTGAVFMEDPFIGTPGVRLYKTGDLGRFRSDGVVEFFGRKDFQVKIRGYRIELGEIEFRLSQFPGVKETVVVDREDDKGDKFLCGYFTAAGQKEPEEIKEFMLGALPEYMVPAYLVQIDTLPLTPNGKVDRKRLPEPEITAGEEYLPPQSEIEEILVTVWAEILGTDKSKIGRDRSFFQLGGDSIDAIRVSARLRREGLKLEVRDLFLYPAVKDVAKCVKRVSVVIDQGPVEGEAPLLPVQKAFFETHFAKPHHYNLSVMLYSKDGFNRQYLEKTFHHITQHHDALRMVYKTGPHADADEGAEGIVQFNRGPEGEFFHLEEFDCTPHGDNYEEYITREAGKLQAGIDLQAGPLLKLGLFKTGTGDHLLVAGHHLVLDGVSFRILLEDLAGGYGQASRGEDIAFQDKTHSYRRWGEKLLEYAGTGALNELEYWKSIDARAVPPLPKDHPVEPAHKMNRHTRTVSVSLEEEDTRRLVEEVNQAYNTEINDILMASLAAAVKEWCGNPQIAVALEGHGREPIIEDMEINRTVGWFTSEFPVILDIAAYDNDDPGALVKGVKENLRRIPNKGVGYGILRYLTPPEKKDRYVFPMAPEILFNYLGQIAAAQGGDDGDLFRFSQLRGGDNASPGNRNLYTLNLNGVISEGRLTLSFTYDANEYEETTIQRLGRCFEDAAKKIIHFCVAKEDTEMTLSDYSTSRLDEEDMDSILEDFED